MFRIRAVVGSLIASCVFAGCSSGDTATTDTGRTTASMSAADSSAPPPPSDPCTVDRSKTSCEHVMPADWNGLDNKARLAWLRDQRTLKWTNQVALGTKRAYENGCSDGQPKQSLRAPDATHRMDTTKAWEPGLTLVMSRFVLHGSGKCADKMYKVNKRDENREFFLVFTVASNTVVTPKGDKVIGAWAIVSMDANDQTRKIDTASSGRYLRCAHDHKYPFEEAFAGFMTCEAKTKLFAIAERNKSSESVVLARYASLSSDDSSHALAVPDSSTDPIGFAIMKLIRDEDPGTAPAWVSCTLSCCVAEDPTKARTATKAAAKIRRASTATKLALARPVSSSN